MDSAPKDGTTVLLFVPDFEQPIRTGHYRDTKRMDHGKVVYEDCGWSLDIYVLAGTKHEPSHWMPLPDKPDI